MLPTWFNLESVCPRLGQSSEIGPIFYHDLPFVIPAFPCHASAGGHPFPYTTNLDTRPTPTRGQALREYDTIRNAPPKTTMPQLSFRPEEESFYAVARRVVC
ncbi:MAG: hypothetical protein H6653_17495 [Ardenticatenaceae bacterium]|nr:hypothetical protein [Ardenticatenaceae bacterium]